MLAFVAPFLYCLLLGSAWAVFFKKKFADSLAPAFMLHIIIVMLSGMLIHKLSVGIWGGVLLFSGALSLKIWKSPQDVRDFLRSALSGGVFIFAIFYVFCFIVNNGKIFIYWDDYSHWGMFVKESLRLDALYAESQLSFWHKDYVPAATMFEVIWCRLAGRFQQDDVFRALQMFGFSMMLPMIARVGSTGSDAPLSSRYVNDRWALHQLGAAFLVMGFLLLLFQSHWHLYHSISVNFYSTISLDAVLGMTIFYCFMQTYLDWEGEKKYQALVLALGFSILVQIKQIGIALLPMAFVFYVVKETYFRRADLRRAEWMRICAVLLVPVFLWCCFVVFSKGFADRLYVTATIARQSYAAIDFSSVMRMCFGGNPEFREHLLKLLGVFARTLMKREIIFLFSASYAAVLACIVCVIFAVSISLRKSCAEDAKKISFAGCFVFIVGISYAALVYLLYAFFFEPHAALNLGPYDYDRYMGSTTLAILLSMLFIFYDSKVYQNHAVSYCILLIMAAAYLVFSPIRVSPLLLANMDAGVMQAKYMAKVISDAVPDDETICVYNNPEPWQGFFQRLRFYLSPRVVGNGADHPGDLEVFTSEQLQVCAAGHDWFFYLGDRLDMEFLSKYADVFESPGLLKALTLYKAHHGKGGGIRLEEKTGIGLGNSDGVSALMLAAWYGREDIAGMLIAKGADLDAASEAGDTALMFATAQGHTEIVRMLIEKGANVNVMNKAGMTALRLAMEHKFTAIAEMLKAAEARE